MFCDLAGSTLLSQQLDPEDLRLPILRFQRLIAAEVARYDGQVARYMGDGALAYFGYPEAHEDDAARAIHAALAIVEGLARLEPPLFPPRSGPTRAPAVPMRIGIATGLVVVGDRIGDGAAEETAAFGEAPNLAARLQAAAQEGEIVVSDSTHQLAGRRFDYGAPLRLQLKGFQEPVRAWQVLGSNASRSRFDLTCSSLLAPLVGREVELASLAALWRQAAAGQGRIVLLAGDAGLGKSRLALALSEAIGSQAHITLRYQCSPYHVDSALHPFVGPLDGAADLLSPPDDSQLATALTPQQRRQRTLAAMASRLRELASGKPVLMLIEDEHWIDPTSLELVDLLARGIAGMPVLIVLTTRSVAQRDWLRLPHASLLQLTRLSPLQSTELVSHLAGQDLAGNVVDEVVHRSDGNPLFIEELTKAAATGHGAPEVPVTLQDSLMARLDRLGTAKEVAQAGAVIGREFSRGLLAALLPLSPAELEDAMSDLVASAVVQRAPAHFVFRHALLQDAAYASLLRTRRQELHARVAEAIVAVEPERASREPEVLARHYALGGRPLLAARHASSAAMRALERSANVEALRQAQAGAEQLASVDAGPERDRVERDLLLLRGAAHRALSGFASTDAERCFTRALQLCEGLQDLATAIEVRRGLFSTHYARGELALARAHGRYVAEAGEQRAERATRMLGQWMLGCISTWQGNFVDARRELERALSLYVPQEHRARALAAQIDPGVNANAHLSWVLWILGEPERALQASDRAVTSARELQQPFALAMALFFACVTRTGRDEYEAAAPLLAELFAVTAEHRLNFLGSCARVLRGEMLIAGDEGEAGLEQVELALREFEAQQAGLGRPWTMAIAAWACQRLGRRGQGLQFIEAALQAIERHGERHWEAEVWRLQGELLWPQAPARACLGRALEIARRQSALSLERRVLASIALREQGSDGR
ncbi:AAA family ATPase [Ramlibacter alkalitolerans]|uniref:AAA family ATPase n=2 Tax=Ramlibacter alkalitolerans TaxID=2039631 RepID=A0ABS1JIS4_9BURK|nr:AAA family ATPase [Ramlibacter alkalitolerans]